MSRALDKDLVDSLKAEDPTPVYEDIAAALNSTPTPPHGQLLEIELIGSSHPLEPGINCLQDENALAIPKLRLVQAFVVARKLLQKHLDTGRGAIAQEDLRATAVILLMDPEHLTAANVRKRAVMSTLVAGGEADSILVLNQEKYMVDSLLTSRLHRHTKSPTLWSHRRWLMTRFLEYNKPLELRQDLSGVIMVAAERHAQNYYAWNHARWLLQHSLHGEASRRQLLPAIVGDVKEWCFRHQSDISGWSYLLFVILQTQQEDQATVSSSVLSDTLGLAKSLRWTNESVWVFVRSLSAASIVST